MYRVLNTDDGMLPQSRPLESRVADNRGAGRNGSGNRAAMQQSRGESSANARPEPSPASAENGVSRVFVLDKRGKPLMPCHPARARKLLAKDRARIHQISGVEYQQGTLFGYEVREYLLERYGRKCVYCDGLSKDPVLEIEHFVPKNPAKGPNGTDRIKNLVIGCRTCNQAKNNYQPEQWAEDLGKSRKKIDKTRLCNLNRLFEGKRPSLAATAAVNATRNAIFRGYLMRKKAVHDFVTGDIVKAEVPKGKKQGSYIGRVAVRKTGSFNIQTKTGTVQGISWRYCQIISRQNGYNLAIQNSFWRIDETIYQSYESTVRSQSGKNNENAPVPLSLCL